MGFYFQQINDSYMKDGQHNRVNVNDKIKVHFRKTDMLRKSEQEKDQGVGVQVRLRAEKNINS